jgi:hypothetical protein
MFRKLLLTSVASLALLSPFAVPAAAEAHERGPVHCHPPVCRVFYRDRCHPGWVCAGPFGNHRAAERCAAEYRCRGFTVYIR